MKNIEKRLLKIENQILNKKHHGVFIIIVEDGIYKIQNENISFKSENDMVKYIFKNYNCDKYIFITLDFNK